jgi:hypothetical protein
MKKYILVLLLIFAASSAFAKPYHRWVKSNPAEGGTKVTNVCYDSEGNIWTAGYFQNNIVIADQKYEAKGFQDAYIQKMTPEGDTEFHWIFAGIGYLDSIATIESDETGIYVVGYTDLGGVMLDEQTRARFNFDSLKYHQFTHYTGYIVKYDYDGNLLWYKTHNNLIVADVMTDDDYVYIGGNCKGYCIFDDKLHEYQRDSSNHITIVKIPKNGNQSEISIDRMESGDINSLVEMCLYKNTFFTLTYNEGQDSNGRFVYPAIHKIENKNGKIRSLKKVTGPRYYAETFLFTDILFTGIEVNSFGQPRVVGMYKDSLYFDDGFEKRVLESKSKHLAGFVLGMTSDLQVQWHHKIDYDGSDGITSLAITNDDKLLIGGITSIAEEEKIQAQGYFDNYIEKLDHAGNSLWSMTSGSTILVEEGIADFVYDIAVQKGNGTGTRTDNIVAVGTFGYEATFGSEKIESPYQTLQGYTWKIADNPNYGIIKTMDTTVMVNSSCNLPIIFEGNISGNEQDKIFTDIEFELICNSTMLFPGDFENEDSHVIEMYVDDINRRHVFYKFENLPVESNNIIELPYIVGWGNDTETRIDLNLINFNSNIDVEIDDVIGGKIKVEGIPHFGNDTILIEPKGTIGNMAVFPTQMEAWGTIEVNVKEDVTGSFYVVNSKGTRVKDLGSKELFKSTEYQTKINIEALPNGPYWMVIEFDNYRPIIEYFEVMK